MKKIIFTALVAMLAATVSAQERTGYRDADRTGYTNTNRSGYTDSNRSNYTDSNRSVYTDNSAQMNDGRNRTAYTDTHRPDMETRGRWAVGPQFGIYTNTDTGDAVFGVGAVVRYDITQRLRVQPAIMALCKEHCSVDISGDLQYLFRVAQWWTLYPQVGIGGNDFNGWSFGVDLGVGTDFAIARRWDLTAAFKWIVQTDKGRKNPMLISVGAAYRF